MKWEKEKRKQNSSFTLLTRVLFIPLIHQVHHQLHHHNLLFYPPNILLPQKSQYFSCYPRTGFCIDKGMMVVVQTIATGCGNSVKLVVLQVRKHPA